MPEKLTLLIRKCRLNQEEAQRDLFDSFFEVAECICSGYSDIKAEQLEIVELGFKKVFKYIYSIDTTSNQLAVEFNQWFRKMMVYAAVECSRNNFKYSSFLYLDPCKLQTFLLSLDKRSKPSVKELKDAIAKLSPSNKLILHLLTIQGFNSSDITRCLEMSHQNTELLISNSIKSIRQLMVKERQTNVQHSCTLH